MEEGFMKFSEPINALAPALRVLLSNDENALKIVRFSEDDPDVEALAFACPEGDDKTIVSALRDAIATAPVRPNAVRVAGVGLFRASDSPTQAGRATGKVAVVTGAAQGFGLEIAQELASEGACVALCDINATGARSAAEDIDAEYGAGRAIGVEIDVTNSESVARAIGEVVRYFGGFDLFVSNAGVLRAESVLTQPEKDFDFVTAVNYKGYYLCAKHAAPILAVQHLARPTYTSDIIQINSKSGLVGSNRNFAYAGSKFGGVGLTQSFALELIEHGIKVNAICPGNFFDGPLWSDPENGLFVQYLRTGKVPGAKTLDDVKRAYESKVPMGRGCRTQDVMTAIFYLMDQQYETGQALPVTGGQVMLS
jgi:sorbitol-6-phosphate 2-dehydrogenase